jgi:type II secretory pathway component HofQ
MSAVEVDWDDESDDVEPSPIGGEAEAEWAVARYARLLDQRQAIGDQHARMVAKYNTWRDQQFGDLDGRMAREYELLRSWMTARTAADPRAPKTVRLPSGTVSVRKGTSVVEIDDPEAFITWAETNGHSGLVRYPEPKIPAPAPDKSAIKARGFTPIDDGSLIEDGEIVPGVRLVVNEPHLHVTIEGQS